MPQPTQVRDASPAAGPAAQSNRIGHWRLERLLDEGSWCQVYQAAPADCTHAADYVLKVLRPERAADPLAMHMLRREAEIGTRVVHPNLASVLAVGLNESPVHIVMPYMAGVSLQEALTEVGCLAKPHALWIARQVASALGELHRTNWLHGDVKPANVFVATSGHATLIDFGMARRLPLSSAGEHHFAGTPDYAAPEWFAPGPTPGPWSDIYSLGVTLHQMLTGRAPETEADLPDQPNGRGPIGIDRLLKQLLATDPSQRPTPGQLVSVLSELEIETLAERLTQ